MTGADRRSHPLRRRFDARRRTVMAHADADETELAQACFGRGHALDVFTFDARAIGEARRQARRRRLGNDRDSHGAAQSRDQSFHAAAVQVRALYGSGPEVRPIHFPSR